VRTQLVDGLFADLLQNVRFLRVYEKKLKTDLSLVFLMYLGSHSLLDQTK
jgi:hypothetical protein